MKIVFFGSSKYSTIDEKALFDAFGLSLVVTTPQTLPNPVKQFTLDHSTPVITTDKISDDVIDKIAQYQPDFIITADIRLILPKKLLTLPNIASLNVHHSLLPKFRGPAPVPYTILSGEPTTGVSIIQISEKVDAGDILAQEKYEMTSEDTTDSVLTKLNQLGGNLVVKVINNFDEYYKNRKPQDEAQATYSHYMNRNDGFIDMNNSPTPQELDMRIRAYFPWPGVWTIVKIKNKEVRIKLLPNKRIQIEGKQSISYTDFIHGYPEGKEILETLHLL